MYKPLSEAEFFIFFKALVPSTNNKPLSVIHKEKINSLHKIITKTEQPRITKITNHKTKQRAEQNLALANEIRENNTSRSRYFLGSDLLSQENLQLNIGLTPLDQNDK